MINMGNELDKNMAARAFRLREARRREQIRLTKFLIGLGAAELFIALVFFVR